MQGLIIDIVFLCFNECLSVLWVDSEVGYGFACHWVDWFHSSTYIFYHFWRLYTAISAIRKNINLQSYFHHFAINRKPIQGRVAILNMESETYVELAALDVIAMKKRNCVNLFKVANNVIQVRFLYTALSSSFLFEMSTLSSLQLFLKI
jgi:hypothetical protein